MSDTLILVPTFNERESLTGVLDRIRVAVPTADVLVVDDRSPDGTGVIADQYSRTDSHVHVLHRTTKAGLGPAYIAGFRWAFDRGYRRVVEIDADGSHDPAVLPTLLDIQDVTDADLVIGSRWVNGGRVGGWSRFRQAVSRIGNTYARCVLRSNIRDMTAGLRVIRTDSLQSLNLDSIASSGYCFQIEIADRIESAGGTVIEHPITFVERAHGRSKMHLGIVAEALGRITRWDSGAGSRNARRFGAATLRRTLRSRVLRQSGQRG